MFSFQTEWISTVLTRFTDTGITQIIRIYILGNEILQKIKIGLGVTSVFFLTKTDYICIENLLLV